MSYDIRLERLSTSRPTAVVRFRAHISHLPKVVPQACGVVWGVVKERQVKGAGRNLTLYLDDQINLEVGVEVEEPFAGLGEVVGSSLPTGEVATAVHFGPYGQLGAAHGAIRAWCAAHGYALAGPNWEIYGHWTDAWNSDPSQIRTDVFYLVDRRI